MSTRDDIDALREAAQSASQAAGELEQTTQQSIRSIIDTISSADPKLAEEIGEIAEAAEQAIINTGVENLQQIAQVAEQRARVLEEALG